MMPIAPAIPPLSAAMPGGTGVLDEEEDSTPSSGMAEDAWCRSGRLCCRCASDMLLIDRSIDDLVAPRFG